ncbi:MAG TPA: PilZ domain-containing protein [Luteitalea sp.]|nr:PilZ domain-containing protein [Luteitalea sp.]
MTTHVIGERRREARMDASSRPGAMPHVPGVRVIEVIDASAHGLRCRIAHPVRPGRTMPLRLAGHGDRTVQQALVLRCEVCRLTRLSVQYEAAWALEKAWRW